MNRELANALHHLLHVPCFDVKVFATALCGSEALRVRSERIKMCGA